MNIWKEWPVGCKEIAYRFLRPSLVSVSTLVDFYFSTNRVLDISRTFSGVVSPLLRVELGVTTLHPFSAAPITCYLVCKDLPTPDPEREQKLRIMPIKSFSDRHYVIKSIWSL